MFAHITTQSPVFICCFQKIGNKEYHECSCATLSWLSLNCSDSKLIVCYFLFHTDLILLDNIGPIRVVQILWRIASGRPGLVLFPHQPI